MILCLMALALLAEVPKPTASWQVSLVPNVALVHEEGVSVLFQGNEVYTYSKEGRLRDNFTISLEVDSAFASPDGGTLIHDGKAILAHLSRSGSLRWQKPLPPPTMPPVVFEETLVFTHSDTVSVIDPLDGSVRYSLRHSGKVGSVLVKDGWLLVSDGSGDTIAWEPRTEAKKTLLNGRDGLLLFLRESPLNDLALVYSGGLLEILRADYKRRWQRTFHIDIATAPVYLSDGKRDQLLVGTMGRNLLIFGAAHGEQIARKLVKGRPVALVHFSSGMCLLVANLVRELLWYSAVDRQFTVLQIESEIVLNSDSSSFLLLVDGNGIIMLYAK